MGLLIFQIAGRNVVKFDVPYVNKVYYESKKDIFDEFKMQVISLIQQGIALPLRNFIRAKAHEMWEEFDKALDFYKEYYQIYFTDYQQILDYLDVHDKRIKNVKFVRSVMN